MANRTVSDEQIQQWDAGGAELPAVTTSDNGKVLKVVGGKWNKADAPAGLPDPKAAYKWNIMREMKFEEFGDVSYGWVSGFPLKEFATVDVEDDFSAIREVEFNSYSGFTRSDVGYDLYKADLAYIRLYDHTSRTHEVLLRPSTTQYLPATSSYVMVFEGIAQINGVNKRVVVTLGSNAANDSFQMYDI